MGPAYQPEPLPEVLLLKETAPESGAPKSSKINIKSGTFDVRLKDLSALRWSPPTSLPAHNKSMAARCVDKQMHTWINYYSDLFQLDKSLVYALIFQESKCNTHAKSHAGAIGLMQLMPQYGARDAVAALTGVWSVIDPTVLKDPQTNIMLGCAYLRMLLNRYAHLPDGEPRIRIALAAYNWGPHRVDRRIPSFNTGDPVTVARLWSAKIPVTETRQYVRAVTHYYFYLKGL